MSTVPVTVPGSALHLLKSEQTGREYAITVSLPLGYDRSPSESWPFNNTPEKWPVVYVLDGSWYAGMVTGIIRPMAWCGSTTDAIVVGIGYAENANPVEAFRDSFTKRDFDLTPCRVEATEAAMEKAHNRPSPNGGADKFHAFIKDDLIPFIESSYRADPARRILAGHSYGGLFALFGLFTTPDLFETLIIGSPTLGYGDRFVVKQSEDFAKRNSRLPVKMYLFVGEHEESANDTTVTDTLRLAATLLGRKYEGFSLVKYIFADQNHCEVAAPGFQGGLKFALKKST